MTPRLEGAAGSNIGDVARSDRPRNRLRLVQVDDPMEAGEERRDRIRALFERLRESGDPDTRGELIERHLGLVEFLAKRFAGRGQPVEDLVQVGRLGLIKAVDRFDERRGFEFTTFATPTIVGELKRHFRDKAWAVRLPRGLQELSLRIGTTISELSQQLGRTPTVAEIAVASDATDDEVLEALEASNAFSPESLDVSGTGQDQLPVHELLGEEDTALELVEDVASLKPALEALPHRDRRILYLRFFKGLTQSEIADELGISQMHVSRLLTATLGRLREDLGENGE
jgi:RNA polymerase sigma-B factor